MNFNQFAEGMAKDTNQLLASSFWLQPTNQIASTSGSIGRQLPTANLTPRKFSKIGRNPVHSTQSTRYSARIHFCQRLQSHISRNICQFDLIFFGFKSDFYDGQSLFTTFRHGQFHYGSYKPISD